MKSLIASSLILIAVATAAPVHAANPGTGTDGDAAKKFVQDFYTWYLQEEKKDRKEDLSTFAFRTKPQWFSKEIVRGLKEDEAAAEKSPGEIVGLDFDPFLNAQDVCEPYKTGAVTADGNSYRVEIFGSCPEPNSKQPDVIAAVEKRNGAWVFVDFLYPGNGDLFSVLQELKKERETPPK